MIWTVTTRAVGAKLFTMLTDRCPQSAKRWWDRALRTRLDLNGQPLAEVEISNDLGLICNWKPWRDGNVG